MVKFCSKLIYNINNINYIDESNFCKCSGPFLVELGWVASCGIGPYYSE